MSDYETSSRRSSRTSTMQSTQHSTVELDDEGLPQRSQRPPPKKNPPVKERKSSKVWLGLMIFLVILYAALIITGAVVLYRNRDYVRAEAKRIRVIYYETRHWLDGRNSTTPGVFNIFLVPVYVVKRLYTNELNGKKYDYSPGYLKASLHLKKNMNPTADPCDDFYEFSCGKFMAETEIPGAKVAYGPFGQLADDVRQQIQSLMESHKPTTSKGIEKMRSMYRKCLDFNSYGEEAIKKAYQLIQEVGYFPMLQGDDITQYWNFDWATFMMKLAPKDLGLQLFGIYGTRDPKNKSHRMVEFAETSLSPYRGVWLNQSAHTNEVGAERTWLRETMETFAKDVGLVPNRQQIEEQIQELLDMHSRLAPFLMADEEKRNYADRLHPEKFGGLVERFKRKTGLDLREWMKAGNPQKAQDFLDQEDLVVNVQRPEFVDNVVSVIKSTPARTLLNYYQLSALSRYRGLFPERYRDISQRYNSVMSGSAEKAPRWKTCLAMANGLRPLMGAFYVRNFYGKKTKAAVKEMADNLQEAFRGIVEEADWMDHDTKQTALRKGNEMLVLIAYGEEAFDDDKLDAPYADLDLSDGQTMLEMVDEHRRWSNEYGWRKFLEPYNRGEFTALASEVNTYNNGDRNAITFPAAILQEPFFDRSWPKALNYGGMGSIIGHEITHGFDDSGKQFDHEGNLINWWSKETDRQYAAKAQCMIDQYNNFTIEQVGMNVNGRQTLGENIADNGGIRESFRAYKKYLEKAGGEEKLVPGLPYTQEQLFFVGFGQAWCTKWRPEALKKHIRTDYHAPEVARVHAVLANQPEFAEAFKCPLGSRLNPKKKCSVW